MNLIEEEPPRNPIAVVASVALWLVTVALGGLSVFALRDVLVWALALILTPAMQSKSQASGVINLSQQCGVIAFGIVALVAVVYSTDRLFRYAGEARLMRILARVILVEAVIVAPVWWLLWR